MIMICPNCGKENKNTNIKCEFCSTQLIDVNSFNQKGILLENGNILNNNGTEVSSKKAGCLIYILILIFNGPFLLTGLAFLGVGLFSSISEHNQTKDYEETTAILKDYTNCNYDDGTEFCEAIYEYQVNGITYTVSPKLRSNRSGFKYTDTVYYNPNNPSESIMYADWNSLTIIGTVILSIIIVIFIITAIVIKKKKRK